MPELSKPPTLHHSYFTIHPSAFKPPSSRFQPLPPLSLSPCLPFSLSINSTLHPHFPLKTRARLNKPELHFHSIKPHRAPTKVPSMTPLLKIRRAPSKAHPTSPLSPPPRLPLSLSPPN